MPGPSCSQHDRLPTYEVPSVTNASTAWAFSSWQYEPATKFFTIEPSPAARRSVWARDNICRQGINLFLTTYMFGLFTYYGFSTLSYAFVFDKETEKHPKYLKNQIRLEMRAGDLGHFFFFFFLLFMDFFVYRINRGLHHKLVYMPLQKVSYVALFVLNYGQYTTLWGRLGGSYRRPNAELFRKGQKVSGREWNKQVQEMGQMIVEVEGKDGRTYDPAGAKKNA
ncbi:C-5 sterol desaturase [Apiospora aurea]|uniref:C-5 sterol desaturase n=1 Tax=Apiospora aurea TaxID=335848 RepID=A0ABR1QCQ3_9PEZI